VDHRLRLLLPSTAATIAIGAARTLRMGNGTNNPPTWEGIDFPLRYSRSLHYAERSKIKDWPPKRLPDMTQSMEDRDLAHLPDWALLRGTYTSLVAFVAHLSHRHAPGPKLSTLVRSKKNTAQAQTCHVVLFFPHHLGFPSPSRLLLLQTETAGTNIRNAGIPSISGCVTG